MVIMHAKKKHFQEKSPNQPLKNHTKPTKQKIQTKKRPPTPPDPKNARTILKSIRKIVNPNWGNGHGPNPVGVQEVFGQWSYRHVISFLGYPLWSLELDLTIITGPFQFQIFYNSKLQNNNNKKEFPQHYLQDHHCLKSVKYIKFLT